MPDCIYLCNSAANNKSSIAYYAQAIPSPGADTEFPYGGEIGKQPDDLVYVGDDGSDFVWEGAQQSFTFPNSGVTLTFNIPMSAQQQQGGFPGGAFISGATASNTFENFQVIKLDGRELVVDGDGVQLNAVYILFGGQL